MFLSASASEQFPLTAVIAKTSTAPLQVQDLNSFNIWFDFVNDKNT